MVNFDLKMKLFVLPGLIFCLFASSLTKAQTLYETDNSLIVESKVDGIVALHIAYNKAFPVFPGYRIQLLMESGNQALQEAKDLTVDFSEKYPETNSYITFREPYYRVRVGDFRTRLEAENFLSQISLNYPSAWVIQDDISFPSLSLHPNTHDHE
ncbi:MAG: hypothetical protein CVT99_14930 [Bacteroidetes bacterium HGW-Bacteroidetes-16]|jgi:hypothetical protein|nr:MAG: hypothetical protein CVT99_14930 [Bacteroidetes bacterium HGW-Bacteroidetes-16]